MGTVSYTIHEPNEFKQDLLARSDEIVFVKDGFAWWAALTPVLWMLYHRLWLPLIGFIIAVAISQIIAYLLGITSESGNGLIALGLSIAFGFLANDIRRMTLARKKYRMVGAIAGSSEFECENRYFQNWEPLQIRLNAERNAGSQQ